MKCGKALPLVEKLADGEAGPLEKREAEAHVASCASCRAHLEFLTSIAEGARSSALPEPPESYWEQLPRKVLRRIEAERRPSRPQSFWRKFFAPPVLRWAGAGAALFVLVAVGSHVLRNDPGVVTGEAPRSDPAPSASTPSRVPEPAAVARTEASTPPMARDEAPPPPAPGPPDTSREEGLTAEAEEHLKSLGYLAPAAEKPAEPPASAPSEQALASGAADLADEAGKESPPERSRENETFELLRRNEAAPASGRAMAESAAIPSSAPAADDCEGRRRSLAAFADEDARRTDALLELARCSLRRYAREGGDELRRIAVGDAEAFLAREAAGERAEEVRAALARIRPEP